MEIKQSNVVVVDLDKYLALNEFKEKILDGKFYSGRDRGGENRYQYFGFNTNDQVLLDLTNMNKSLVNRIDELKDKLSNINNNANTHNEKGRVAEREYFSTMSVWDFLRWRKDYKIK